MNDAGGGGESPSEVAGSKCLGGWPTDAGGLRLASCPSGSQAASCILRSVMGNVPGAQLMWGTASVCLFECIATGLRVFCECIAMLPVRSFKRTNPPAAECIAKVLQVYCQCIAMSPVRSFKRTNPPAAMRSNGMGKGLPILCARVVPRGSHIFNGKGHPAAHIEQVQLPHPRTEAQGSAPPSCPGILGIPGMEVSGQELPLSDSQQFMTSPHPHPRLPDDGPRTRQSNTVLPLPPARVLEMTAKAKSKAGCPVGPHSAQVSLPLPARRGPCPFPRVQLNGKECVITPSTTWDGEPPHPRDMYPLDVILALSTNGWTIEETAAMVAECRQYWAWKDGSGDLEAQQQRRARSRSRSRRPARRLTLRELLRNF